MLPRENCGLERSLLAEMRGEFGLEGELTAEYVPNPGGYVNANFTVTDGTTRLHVKLASERTGLDRWFDLRDLLMSRYRAPEILGRVELPDLGRSGLVFAKLDGHSAGDDLIPEIAALARRVHADRELARLVRGVPVTHLSAYLTGIHECLSEDLEIVKADPEVRGWLSAEEMAFLETEVRRLRALGEEQLSDEACTAAIHGDLWLENVLVTEDDWFLLDWDDLGIGDPAAEYAALLREPSGRGIDSADLLPSYPLLRRRFDLHLRAGRFDAVVDPLADCAEMPEGVPERDRTRAGKRRLSEEAFRAYRERYR